MGLFGMSEADLKKFAKELEEREIQLKNRESDVAKDVANAQHERGLLEADKASFVTERDAYRTEVKRISDAVAVANADLEKRRQEVLRLEAEAKAGFAAKQKEVFQVVVEQRIAGLDARESDLEALAKRLADDLSSVVSREGEVAKRELAVTEREQRADAGFADKATALAAETKRQHEANLREADALRQRAEQLEKEKEEIEKVKETLRQRESAVVAAERERDAGYSEERAAFDSELNEKRVAWQIEERSIREKLVNKETTLLADLASKIDQVHQQRYDNMEKQLKREREHLLSLAAEEVARARQQVAQEKSDWEQMRVVQQSELQKINAENQKRAGELAALENRLKVRDRELDARTRDLEARKENLETEVSELVAGRKASFDAHEQALNEEIDRLRDSLRSQEELVGCFEQLKHHLGDRDAEEVLNELAAKTKELKQLREKLAEPNLEQEGRISALQKSLDEQKAMTVEKEKQLAACETAVAESAALRRSCNELTLDKQSLTQQLERVTAAANAAEAELRRLRSAYERPSEVAARYHEIEMPFVTSDKFTAPGKVEEVNELEWLNGIDRCFKEHGFDFSPRIIKAFHTSLKTAEWSPITVLAGVSGTGKSKLPELYSRFGGFVFDLLDVQPNWDSQESMLGFFNSIDNKFDAQSVLKLLAQSQIPANESYEERVKRWDKMAGSTLTLDPEKDEKLVESLKNLDSPGLANCMCLVLLDEMNLAHPELYFAGFLSKLEERSGKGKSSVPALEVKVGAGLPAYKLPLGRNVLWVGTMNQDETTKSLSDKVLDRSTVIFFPRPRTLKGRENVKVMKDEEKAPLLNKGTFAKWVVHDCASISKFAEPYKAFVEEINNALGTVGRAIGHRVWQSIEYYMANYPDVRAAINDKQDESVLKQAMHVAFEDQLVQKVMPKLRGIDCRGDAKTQCLDVIKNLLIEGVDGNDFKRLVVDFDLACKLGYGQFMWQSANYLDEEVRDQAESVELGTSPSETSTEVGSSTGSDGTDLPPEWFRPNDEKRVQIWSKYTPERRGQTIQNHAEHEKRQ